MIERNYAMQKKLYNYILCSIILGTCSMHVQLHTNNDSSSKQTLTEIGNNSYEPGVCLNKEFKKYMPPIEIQSKLENIFSNKDIFQELEKSSNPKEFLQELGFKVLQFGKYNETVVIESKKLPGWIIKFVRIIAQEEAQKALTEKLENQRLINVKVRPSKTNKERINVVITPDEPNKKRYAIPNIVDRVINAQKIRDIIKENGYEYVYAPKKYLYCINDVAIVLAEKAIASNRTFKDLTGSEIIEILELASKSGGILDLRVRNMMLSKDKIVFIDTERDPNILGWTATSLIKKTIPAFKKEINPKYVPLVEEWEKNNLKDKLNV